MSLELYQCLLEKNRWYRSGNTIPIKGIVVHSSGANNPTLKRYVQPHASQNGGMAKILPNSTEYDRKQFVSILGENSYGNDWNRADQPYGMHAFVGKMNDGSVAAVQTLPWNSFLWGVGTGKNGSYNGTHIQFEICEDTTDKEYTLVSYKMAAELCAHLCKAFDLPVESIVSHYEAGKTGYGSTHVDPTHWWSLYALSMDGFRDYVRQLMGGAKAPVDEVAEAKKVLSDKAGLSVSTIEYLQAYTYGNDLIKKLAKAMK